MLELSKWTWLPSFSFRFFLATRVGVFAYFLRIWLIYLGELAATKFKIGLPDLIG
jgi:hypothetical protein